MSRPAANLAKRRAEILRLVAEGMTNAEIATELVAPVDAVRGYLLRVAREWGARNRAQCVHLAYQLGVLRTSSPRPLKPLATPARPQSEQLFEKVGMVYQAVQPKTSPAAGRTQVEQVPATHVLAVDHPADPKQSWRLDVCVTNDEQALLRACQLADWVHPPFVVSVTRNSDQLTLSSFAGCRDDSVT